MRIGSVVLAVSLTAACDVPNARGPAGSRAYPVARLDTVVDVYHGMRVANPYRWLEHLDTPDVRTWVTAQTALVSQVIGKDSLRGWFLEHMLHHAKAWDQMERDDGDDSTRALLDPRTFGPTKKVVRSQMSPDGKYVVYALSEGASEWVETRIRRVSDGVDLQAAQSCDRPILLRAMHVGGHSGDRGPDSWIEDAADALAFIGRRFEIQK